MKKRIKRQSFIQGVLAIMFSQIIIKICGLVYKLYLTNKGGFGDEGNAIYTSGYQIYALFLTFSSLGVPNAISKLISERLAIGDARGAQRVFKIAFGAFSFVGLMGTAILFFGSGYIANNLLEIPSARYSLIALSPSIFFASISAVFRGYFNGYTDMKATANSQSLEQLFKTVITVLLVEAIAITSKNNTLFMAAGANLATTFATALSFLYIYIYYRSRKQNIWKEIKLSVNYKQERIIEIIKKILNVSIPVALTALMMVINKNIDSFTVVRNLKTFLSETDAIKQYGILSGKIDTLVALPLALNAGFAVALIPAISSAVAKNEHRTVVSKISFSLLIAFLISLPCTMGFLLLAEPILNLLFPNASSGALILQITSFSIIFTMISQTNMAVLQGIGKAPVTIVAFLIGVLVKLILNLVLIKNPQIGVNGAAFSTVISNLITCIMLCVMTKKYVGKGLKFINLAFKTSLATAVMGICTYFSYLSLNVIISEKIATIISIIIAIVIYILSILILKVISKENMKFFTFEKNT